MPTDFRIEHTWPVSREVILAHHFDAELHARTDAAITSADRKRLSIEERAGKTVQRFQVRGTQIPAAARKVLKPEMLEWIEESTWDPGQERFDWRIEPHLMKDTLRAQGRLWYEALPDGSSRRVVTGTVEVRIPLAGRMIEKVLISQIQHTYDQSAAAEGAYFGEQAGG